MAADFEAILTALLSTDNQVRSLLLHVQISGGLHTLRSPGASICCIHMTATTDSTAAITLVAAAAAAHIYTPVRNLQVRKQAEEAVQNVANRPEVVAETLRHVQHAANPEVRQLAAVLLRKWVPRHWTKIAPEVREVLSNTAAAAAAGRQLAQRFNNLPHLVHAHVTVESNPAGDAWKGKQQDHRTAAALWQHDCEAP
jgi:mannitol-specific phosphotransferase system IIBC component